MKTILFTPYDCLLKADGQEHFLKKNQKCEFSSFPSSLAVYPTSQKGIIPFMIKKEDSSFFKIVQTSDEALVFLLDGLFSQSVQIYPFPALGCNVEISSQKIYFITKTLKKEINIPLLCQEVECGSLHHIIYTLFSQGKERVLLCFNCKNALFKIFYAEKISLTKEGFSLSQANGVNKELFVDKEGLKVRDGSSCILFFTSPLNIPLCFMECLKEKEFSRALSFLSPSLSSQTEEDLHAFFGEIDYLFPVDTQRVFALSGGRGKVYSFQTENGKIQEISDN